mgnify:CR=1 FL=1
MLRSRIMPCSLAALALVGCSDDGRPQTDASDTTPASTTLPATTTGGGTTDDSTGAPTSGAPTTGGGTTGGAGGEGDACMVTGDCSPGLVCAGGECAPTDGDCVGDDDCTGDTFCCADGCVTRAGGLVGDRRGHLFGFIEHAHGGILFLDEMI